MSRTPKRGDTLFKRVRHRALNQALMWCGLASLMTLGLCLTLADEVPAWRWESPG